MIADNEATLKKVKQKNFQEGDLRVQLLMQPVSSCVGLLQPNT